MPSLPLERAVNVAELLRALVNCPELENLILGNEIVLGEEPISGTPGILLSASSIDIEARISSVMMDAKSEDIDTRVCLVFHEGQPAEVGKWMAECFAQGQAPVSLDIVAQGTLWIEAFPSILSKFSSTVKLTLSGDETICQQVIEFLGTAIYTDPAGYQHFPVPKLTFMGFMVECTPNFLSMVERRYGQYGPTDVPNAGRPVGLAKLWLLGGKEMVALGSTFVQKVALVLPGCEVELS
ncbi:hypothetical protein FRC00_000968 [Tulasnella sp. 408]|nr:hypothetical protein FRC00_000968 [Tulasnella sp. 408]